MRARDIGKVPSNYVPKGADEKITVRFPISDDDLGKLNALFGGIGTLAVSNRLKRQVVGDNRTRLVESHIYDTIKYDNGRIIVTVAEQTCMYSVTAAEHPYWYVGFGSMPLDLLAAWWDKPIEVSHIRRDGGNAFWDEISVRGLFRSLSFMPGLTIDWDAMRRAEVKQVRLLSFDPFLSELDKMTYLSEVL